MKNLLCSLALCIASICSAKIYEDPSLPHGMRIIELPSKRTVIQADAQLGMTFRDASDACAKLDGSLLDVYNNDDFKYLGELVETPHWIKSFDGRYFDESMPVALFHGPAIATPRDLASSNQGFFCQINEKH